MAIRQTRIFAPPTIPFDGPFWAETLVALIVAPLAAQAEWYWFSRYAALRTDSGDCSIELIPNEFGVDQNGNSVGAAGLFRSLRFRYEVSDEQLQPFEASLAVLIGDHHCAISDCRSYPLLDDLGGDRFLGGERNQERRLERADLMSKYLFATCRILIHCLQGPDASGRFRLETSDNTENPQGSIFESAHHLFCNITDVPLRVLVSPDGIGTDWSSPPITDPSKVAAFRIRF